MCLLFARENAGYASHISLNVQTIFNYGNLVFWFLVDYVGVYVVFGQVIIHVVRYLRVHNANHNHVHVQADEERVDCDRGTVLAATGSVRQSAEQQHVHQTARAQLSELEAEGQRVLEF